MGEVHQEEAPHGIYSEVMAKLWDIGSWANGHKAEGRYDMKRLVELTGVDPRAKLNMLGLGCGTGVLEMAALEEFPNARLTAIDRSQPMIDRFHANMANRFPDRDVTAVVGDVREKIGELRQEFDLILGSGIFEHIPTDLLTALLPECRNMLKPGGHLLDAAVRNSFMGRIIARICKCPPMRPEAETMKAFRDAGFETVTDELLPWRPPHTYNRLVKKLTIFRKPETAEATAPA